MENREPQQQSASTGRLVGKLLLTVVAMFGFGFALVPLYDVFCEITGLNGKTGGQVSYEAASAEIDESRLVTVQFATRNNAGMPWRFEPLQRQIKVHPGELVQVDFIARNPTQHTMIAQAIPSVSPFEAADMMHKTECFCFNRQELGPGEEIEMPLLFYIDRAIPEEISKLTLSYTLFDVTRNFVTQGP